MNEFQKSQNIRLFDVWVIGPYLIYLGIKGEINKTDKAILGLFGISTIFYNLNNYLRNKNA